MKIKILVLTLTASAMMLTISASAVSFQNGFDGYAGTVDTYVSASAGETGTSFGGQTYANSGYGLYQALLRFDDIFGVGTGQIPTEFAKIDSAILTINIEYVDANNTTYGLYRMLTDWEDTDTYDSLGGGVQADGSDALSTPDGTFTTTSPGFISIDVTSSIQAWQNGASNEGWLVQFTAFSFSNGMGLSTSEYFDFGPSRHPHLEVEYTPTPEASTFLPLLAVLGALSVIRRKRK